MMEPFVTMGLVLKETRYREADRILTILTPKLGVITAMAANSLRLKSKLFSACGLFCYSEFTLVPGRILPNWPLRFRLPERKQPGSCVWC